MRELLVLRHAKSSRDDPTLDDHERPLAKRGERDAKAIGAHIQRQGLAPKLVLCSSARRARDTFALIAPFLPADHEMRIERALYLASARALLKRLQAVGNAVPSLMLVGHNPGLEELVLQLARKDGEDGEKAARLAIEEKFPTGALAVLRFAVRRWSSVATGKGELVSLVRPRDLNA
jgi:phosphohistidine phosphatase